MGWHPVRLPGAYFMALLFSIGGLISIDLKHSLALRPQPRRTLLTLGISVAVFLAWDLIGIASGVFFEGDSGLTLGINLLPNLPLEEIFFLVLFNYSILLGYLALERGRSRRLGSKATSEVAE
jgi:lycopene cyclase domain-containing protein